jgi:hypothetical protein
LKKKSLFSRKKEKNLKNICMYKKKAVPLGDFYDGVVMPL